MSSLTAAYIQEQGVSFVVAQTEDHVLDDPTASSQKIQSIKQMFNCPNVVLMGDITGKLRGEREDIVAFVAGQSRENFPWQTFG